MYFTSGQDRAFERLMQEKPSFDHYDGGGANAPEDCGSCRFYRPDWKYQYCVYAECPYQPGKLTALAAVKFTVKGADDDMAVFRVEKNKGYTVMSNHHLRNKALSLKAKGLLPAMKSVEITDLLVEAMASGKYQFLRCNYPNGDMVGHTGVLSAVITAMEAVDAALARVKEAADKYGYTLLVTADHGNADQMLETKKGKTSVRTAHSLNPVPFIIYDPDNKYEIKDGHYGLANVAPTIVTMMGLETPDCWQPSMI